MSFTILTDNDKKISQPKQINIKLMNHQKTMIYRMMELEETGIINITTNINTLISYINPVINTNNIEITTNMAILGDKVGSGKTLMIITLLTLRKTAINRPLQLGGSQYCTLKTITTDIVINTNILILPHKLIPQWKKAFDDYSPELNVYVISTNKHIDTLYEKTTNDELKEERYQNSLVITKKEVNEILAEVLKSKDLDPTEIEYLNKFEPKYIDIPYRFDIDFIKKYDIVIISDTMIKNFTNVFYKYKFTRIIIDEADTIKLPRYTNFNSNFLWFISGTPYGVVNCSKTYLNNYMKGIGHKILSKLVIQNEDEYIDQSIVLPHPKIFKIKCITPREIMVIKDLIPPSILQMINAGNSEQAIKTLNCNIDTDENILQVVTKNLTESIQNKEIELEAEQRKYYSDIKDKEHKIKIITNHLEKLKQKYEDIKAKIYELNDTNCPVCMDDFTNPTIVSCCNTTFCFNCLALALSQTKTNKCPYCRQGIKQGDLHVVKNDKLSELIEEEQEQIKKKSEEKKTKRNNNELKEKMDVLIDIITKKPNGSFMIFAGYSDTFNKIEVKLREFGIKFYQLKGQANTIKRYIEEFREKKVSVLLLNANFFGAGMNLQMATDIIIYHRFDVGMEEQIVGRAQRLGRAATEPLNVHYLLHENESDNIQNRFEFEEQNIHYLDWLDDINQNNERKKEEEEKKFVILNDIAEEEFSNYDNDDIVETEEINIKNKKKCKMIFKTEK